MKKFKFLNQFFSIILSCLLITGCNNTVDRDKLSQALTKYDNFSDFSDNGFCVVSLNGKYGVINKSGKEMVSCKYDYIDNMPFSKSKYSQISIDDKYGYLDMESGKEIIPCKYERIYSFSDGIAVAYQDEKYLLVNENGKEVYIEKDYNQILPFSDGVAAVRIGNSFGYGEKTDNELWGYIDKTGKEVIPPKEYFTVDVTFESDISYVCSFKDGFAPIGKDRDHWGFIDKSGKEVVPFKYSFVRPFSDGLAAVLMTFETSHKEYSVKWGFIDKTGKEVIPCKYDYISPFSESMAAVQKNGLWGFVDKDGKEVIPCDYEQIMEGDDVRADTYFSEGLVGLRINGTASYGSEGFGKCGFLDKNGKVAIPFIYDYVSDFNDGIAFIMNISDKNTGEGKYGIIDKSGKEIISCELELDNTPYFHSGLANVTLNGEDGFIDKDGYFIGKGYVKKISNSQDDDSKSDIIEDTIEKDNKWLIGTWEVQTSEFGLIKLYILDERNAIQESYKKEYGTYSVHGDIMIFLRTSHTLNPKNQTISFGEGLYFRKTSSSVPKSIESNESSHQNIRTSKPIVFNSEIQVRDYLNNKTFKSQDGLLLAFRMSDNTVYTHDNKPFGTLEIKQLLKDRVSVGFYIRSPYRTRPIMYVLTYILEINSYVIADEENRIYYLQ